MSSATCYPHLNVADDGSVRIGATRYKVLHLATEHFHHGWSAEELLKQTIRICSNEPQQSGESCLRKTPIFCELRPNGRQTENRSVPSFFLDK